MRIQRDRLGVSKYDPGFVATQGTWVGQKILVEIFGNAPGGNLDYARVQAAKIEFNKRYPNFLAVNYQDCYDDRKLVKLLEPYIGRPERVIVNESLPETPAVMLSTVDDTLKRCQEICNKMPDGLLPTLPWFQHRQVQTAKKS